MRRAARKPVPPQAATAIRRLNECADCDAALSALSALDAAELTLTYGPNAINVAMRCCASRLEVAETLFANLDGLADIASFEIIASARLQHGALEGAASAAAAGLACVERQPSVRCGVKLARTVRRVLDECSSACVPAREARERWRLLDERGLLPPGFHWRGGTGAGGMAAAGIDGDAAVRGGAMVHLRLERTLAVLKPDAVRGGLADEIAHVIVESGFEVLARRRWRMSEAEAATFLATSWGAAKRGDVRRRFFTSMVDFYSSGEVEALLLERAGAVGAWRALLGPGDPAQGRLTAPHSIRARYGSNKQANAAHGADAHNVEREVCVVFGEAQRRWAWAGESLEGGGEEGDRHEEGVGLPSGVTVLPRSEPDTPSATSASQAAHTHARARAQARRRRKDAEGNSAATRDGTGIADFEMNRRTC